MNKLLLFILIILISLTFASCKREKSTSLGLSGSSRVERGVPKTKRKSSRVKKAGFSSDLLVTTDPSSFDYYARLANDSIILVEKNPPEWIIDYFHMLQKKKPILKIVLISSSLTCEDICINIENLKASYAIFDRIRLLINPIYNESDSGVSLITMNLQLISSYEEFAASILEK